MSRQNSTNKRAINEEGIKVICPEQFTQIIASILDGKYSWACLLLLRFSGYNPLDYIPYRTYNRLIKENCQPVRELRCETVSKDKSSRPFENRLNSISSHDRSLKTTEFTYQDEWQDNW